MGGRPFKYYPGKECEQLNLLLNDFAEDIHQLSMIIRRLFGSRHFSRWRRYWPDAEAALIEALWRTGLELEQRLRTMEQKIQAVKELLGRALPYFNGQKFDILLQKKYKLVAKYKQAIQWFLHRWQTTEFLSTYTLKNLRSDLVCLADEINYYDCLIDLNQLGFKLTLYRVIH